jgi:hypothetical protein
MLGTKAAVLSFFNKLAFGGPLIKILLYSCLSPTDDCDENSPEEG